MIYNIALPTSAYLRKHLLLLGFAMLLYSAVTAQFTVTLQLKSIPANHQQEAVFVAGSFNNWNPADEKYKLTGKQGGLSIELKGISKGDYQFKFTRGTWDKVESSANGADVNNHSMQLQSDTTIFYDIISWKDDFAAAPKLHSASSNVKLLDTAFYVPQLKKHRRIWIYLPPNYKKEKKHYPVLYMHDGQNLFDTQTAPFGEWGVDECLDSLIANGKPACIVVGIDNGGESRMNEYNPFEFVYKDSVISRTFPPQGDEYLEFLVSTLKPYIDKHYRTIKTKEQTIIAGSSMGGLISYYAALKYPEVFGKAGVFSPAFWTANGIDEATDSLAGKVTGKLFFYMGEKEGRTYVADMKRVLEALGAKSQAMIYSMIDPDGEHNEKAWQKWFPEFYNWIMADGYNIITKDDNQIE